MINIFIAVLAFAVGMYIGSVIFGKGEPSAFVVGELPTA